MTINETLQKADIVLDALLKFDKEDPSKITLKQIQDEIFGHKRETSDTNFQRDVSDSIHQQDEIGYE